MSTNQIRKWGNSAAIRLSSEALNQACFSVDQIVSIKASKGRIIIEAVQPAYDLDKMLASVEKSPRTQYQPHTKRIGAEIIKW